MSRPSGLGRGLSALLGDLAPREPEAGGDAPDAVRHLPVDAIEPHPDQPRRHFDEATLDELAASIAERGVIQPIIVRPFGDRYQIVAGERRWRAAKRARLEDVPALVRAVDDTDLLQIALLENIQRQDLNAIEEAEAYRRLIDDFGHTQDALARSIHKSRSHVANLLRLLELPERVRNWVTRGDLTMGHARALIGAADAESLGQQVIARGLSVRDAERLARTAKRGGAGGERKPAPPPENAEPSANGDVAALEQQLADMLGIQVRIAHGEKGGTVTLNYATLDQLDMLCQRLSGELI